MATLSQVSKSSPANVRSTIPAGVCLRTGALVAIVVLSLFGMVSAQAIDIPALPVVPPQVAAANPALAQQRETLISERKALLDKTNKHNSMCSAVEAGSAAESICTRAYAPLEAEIKSHVQVSKQYNTSLLAAANLAASQKPAPHTDTSVVDARVPRDGAYLTDRVPELKNSPAADRITKGFQAVINHDWPVALAWWQDALNRDPNNAALKRSVDLAQWMVDRSKTKTAKPVTPLGAAIYSASHGDSAEAIRQFELVKKANPAIAPQVDDMITTLRQQQEKNANETKLAALREEYIKGNQRIVDALFERGMNRLSIGDQKGAQGAFDDATEFGGNYNVQPSQLSVPKSAKTK